MPSPTNASLRLTKFQRLTLGNIPAFNAEANRKRFEWVERAAIDVTEGSGYRRAYERWMSSLQHLPGVSRASVFAVQGRMVPGIGQTSVLENALSVHRIWQAPIIPGSSLKGLAHHYADWLERERLGTVSDDQRDALFGSTKISGAIVYHDAWYVPDSPDRGHPFILDTITAHYPDWYENADPPAGFDDPTPVPLASARGHYLVAVTAPDESWAQAVLDLLTQALADWGIGARTNVGYGRLTPVQPNVDLRSREEIAAETAKQIAGEALAAKEAAIALLRDDLASEALQIERPIAQRWAETWTLLTDDGDKTATGVAIARRLQRKVSVYHKVTGRLTAAYPPPGKARVAASPAPYFKPLIAWLDEHAPEVFDV